VKYAQHQETLPRPRTDRSLTLGRDGKCRIARPRVSSSITERGFLFRHARLLATRNSAPRGFEEETITERVWEPSFCPHGERWNFSTWYFVTWLLTKRNSASGSDPVSVRNSPDATPQHNRRRDPSSHASHPRLFRFFTSLTADSRGGLCIIFLVRKLSNRGAGQKTGGVCLQRDLATQSTCSEKLCSNRLTYSTGSRPACTNSLIRAALLPGKP
jgi:hypothetical protein